MPEKPIMHGRDHRPGGTDPIPGVGGAAWAILTGTQVITGGSASATLAAGANGVCSFTHFWTGGDLGVFATHNTVDYPGFPSSPVPDVASFNNSSGDTWVFAVKTGVLVFTYDITWTGTSTFPVQVGRTDGNSSYQGGEQLGPQAWYSPVSGATVNTFSWSSIRPIDNDPGDYDIEPGDDYYYEFEVQVTNNDSASHTIDSSDGFQLTVGWYPVMPQSLNHYY